MDRAEVVEIVRKALWDAWWPNGHAGETDERLWQDWENWQKIAGEDAEVAVAALVDAGLICNTAQDVYDGGQEQDQ